MSRIGNNPVKLPPKVEVTLANGEVSVKGPLGSLSRNFGSSVTIEQNGEELVFKAVDEEAGPMHGTVRAIVANMVKGVTQGFEKRLTLVGVGYRAQASGDKINLSLGFSHPVVHNAAAAIRQKAILIDISSITAVARLGRACALLMPPPAVASRNPRRAGGRRK
jgi:large subunit ribosomal protein L6